MVTPQVTPPTLVALCPAWLQTQWGLPIASPPRDGQLGAAVWEGGARFNRGRVGLHAPQTAGSLPGEWGREALRSTGRSPGP